jgi:two-component system OmpR family sensor kinase
MKLNSVRAKLTLWNVGVLALTLALFGGTLLYTYQAGLLAGIDRDLTNRTRGFAQGWSRDPHLSPEFALRISRIYHAWRPGSPIPPDGPAPTPELPERFGIDSAGGADPSPEEEENRRQMRFRRPRVIDRNGLPAQWWSADHPWDQGAFARTLAGHEVFSTVEVDGEPIRVASVPLYSEGKVWGVVQFARSLAQTEAVKARLVTTMLTFIPLALLVAAVGGAFLASRALRPVRDLREAAAEITAEDLSRRLVVTGNDEFSDLASTFNGMIARLETAFQKLEAAFEQQRRFTGDASHELRTPLTTIKANTSLALASAKTPLEYREALRAADEAADTMTRIVQDLLLLARSDGGQLGVELRPTTLLPVLERAAAVVRDPEGASIEIETDQPGLAVLGDAHLLNRLFVNLLENAVRHTAPEGRITLRTERTGDGIAVRVTDTGEGIPPEHLPHVCERFYRVDSARGHSGYRVGPGTGLGLAICQSIVEAHYGRLEIESEPGRGTSVSVTLSPAPAAREASLQSVSAG